MRAQSQLEVVVARATRGREPGVCTSIAQTSIFNGTTSYVVFQRQFETIAEHNHWSPQGKSTYLVTALKGRATDVLYSIPTKNEDPEGRGIPARFFHSHWTSCPPCLPHSALGPHKERNRESVHWRGRRPRNKSSTADRRGENGNRGPQRVTRTTSHTFSCQAPQNKHQDILGEPFTPSTSKGTPGNQHAEAVENQATSSIAALMEGRQKMTGTEHVKIFQRETCRNHGGAGRIKGRHQRIH
jgi:hypothetical protein